MSSVDVYGFACTHWALGGLVLVALAASEYSGAGTVVALPIAALGISCAALCSINEQKTIPTRRKYSSNIVHFLEIWLNILEHLVAAATCARVASATVDYSTGGRMREWLFGWENHSLGEPWPDVLGITIIALVSTLFMLGLEKSSSFCILLYCGIFASFTFFVSVGGYHTDIRFWNWTLDFKSKSWGYILTTAAMCSFGFANSFPSALSKNYFKICVFVLMPLICYFVIALVFTFMSHYSEVTGTAIPLVRVFEVRDVDWARPVMASCTICVVCLALTEIMPSLYNLLIKLAGVEWSILVSPILYRNSLTGAPVLAIFTAGSLSAILAFACPLSYLVRLLNISSLCKCSLKASLALFVRYKPEFYVDDISVLSSSIQYSMLNQTKIPTKKRNVYDMLPSYLRKNNSTVNTGETTRSRKSPSGDKEYLLLNQYNNMSPDSLIVDDDSESDVNAMSANASDAEESTGSSTDIDAVVQEYKERIQVATINTFVEKRTPTLFTSRIVCTLIFLLTVNSSMLSLGISLNMPQLAWSAISILMLCLFGICVMPQNILNQENLIVPPLIYPIICIIAIIINTLLATTLFEEIWPALLLWILAGFVLYSRCKCCGFCEEDRDRIPFSLSKTECSIGECSSNHDQKFIEVDTIIIPR